MNEEDFKNKKETYIDFLKNDASLQLNWAQKKEVAVWTATVFYLGVIYILYEIHLKYLDGCENHINMILLEYHLDINRTLLGYEQDIISTLSGPIGQYWDINRT